VYLQHAVLDVYMTSCRVVKQQFLLDFLADRTNGRAIATLLRLSSSSSVVVVCRRL